MKTIHKNKNPLISPSAIPTPLSTTPPLSTAPLLFSAASAFPSVIPTKVEIQRKKCHLPAGGSGKSGQMMLLMVIIIAATTLAIIAFSSFALVSELRHITDARATGAALFAADTGIECVLFREFGDPQQYANSGCPDCAGDCRPSDEAELFPGGPKFKFQFISRRTVGQRLTVIWEAIGRDASGRAVRSLEITLTEIIN